MAIITREEWLAERRKGIGGSDVAAILGISPWATPVSVWLDKTGRAAPKPETEAMRIGTELEDFVARRYMQETGRAVQRYNKIVHKGCLLGNYDRLVVKAGEKIAAHQGEIRTDTILECKTSSVEWEDGVPVYYQTQVQHYMGLTACISHSDVACLFLGRKHFEVFRIERDDEVINAMQEKLSAWWEEFVVGNKMPLPTNEEDCRLLWAKSNPGKTIVSNSEIDAKLDEYRQIKSEEKVAKERAILLQSDICAYMGDSEILTDEGGKPLLTWKSPKDTVKTDWEALARSLGATDEQIRTYTEIRPGTRRFLPKKVA